MRINGVGSEYSDLLEAAGVDSPPELAQRNAANLAITFQEVVAARPTIVRRIPTEAEVTDWIEQAKALPRVVEHGGARPAPVEAAAASPASAAETAAPSPASAVADHEHDHGHDHDHGAADHDHDHGTAPAAPPVSPPADAPASSTARGFAAAPASASAPSGIWNRIKGWLGMGGGGSR